MSIKKWLAGLCALFLPLTGCTPAAEEVPDTSTPIGEESPMSVTDKVERLMAVRDLDEIFALEDDGDFACALSSALADWTEYGQYLDRLSPEAQVFYLCEAVENKVNCDGLYGFILEFYGHWAPETVDALETVGAPQMADILRRAIAPLPDGICPKDDIERENILLDNDDYYFDVYDKLDNEFFAYPDGVLLDLYASYARDHRDCFSAPEK